MRIRITRLEKVAGTPHPAKKDAELSGYHPGPHYEVEAEVTNDAGDAVYGTLTREYEETYPLAEIAPAIRQAAYSAYAHLEMSGAEVPVG